MRYEEPITTVSQLFSDADQTSSDHSDRRLSAPPTTVCFLRDGPVTFEIAILWWHWEGPLIKTFVSLSEAFRSLNETWHHRERRICPNQPPATWREEEACGPGRSLMNPPLSLDFEGAWASTEAQGSITAPWRLQVMAPYWRNSSPENENPIIYSHSCCFKAAWFFFFP